MDSAKRLQTNLETVRDTIASAALRSGRDPRSVTLVAVTKRRSDPLVRGLADLGANDLGENYPQELWEKAGTLADLDVRWHLIGHLQGNKIKKTFPLVKFIHGVDSLRLLEALDEAASTHSDPPEVFLQVNTSGEASKHGWSADELLADAEKIASLKSIPIRGLMTMAGYGTDDATARPSFVRLREVRDAFQARSGLILPELSMGMSGDYVAAVEEGATFVRVGSALFEGVEP